MSNSIVGQHLGIGAAAPAVAAPQEDTTTPGNPSRVDGGALTMDQNGNVSQRGVVRATHGPVPQNPAEGVMASAMSPTGSRSAAITEKSIVTLPGGMQTSIAAACAMGILRRAPNGGFEEVGGVGSAAAAVPATTTQQAPAASAPAEVPIHPETVAVIDKLSASVPPGMMAAAVNAALLGQPVRDIGEHSTLGNDEFTRGVEHVVASLQAHATHVLGTRGIDGADFRAWAETKHPGEFRAAARVHFETGSVSAYDNLAARYEKLTVTDPTGTYPTRTNAEGMMEVEIPGAGWLSLKVAKRAGLI